MDRQRIGSGTQWEDEVGYSRAVKTGDTIRVSGTTATDENGEFIGTSDPYEQARRTFANIERALSRLDASLSDVVRTRMYVTDIDEWEAIGRVHGEFFSEVRPATTMVEVARLIDPEMVVEVEAVAVVDD